MTAPLPDRPDLRLVRAGASSAPPDTPAAALAGALDPVRCCDCAAALPEDAPREADLLCAACVLARESAEAHDRARFGAASHFLPTAESLDQIADAKIDVRDARTYPSWPYHAVRQLAGDYLPGRLIFIAANTGQGKTTFTLDMVRRLVHGQAAKVYMLGLEQQPKELRTKLACLDADVPASVAFQRSWAQWPDATARDRVLQHFEAQAKRRWTDWLYLNPQRRINRTLLRAVAKEAEAFGATLLLVDHIDRLDHGTGANSYKELADTVQLCKDLAVDHNLTVVCTSQMNREASKGSRLAKYFPPQLHQVFGGSVKEHEGDVWLGLWRPIRTDVSPKLLKRASQGLVEVREVIAPNTMGVICMKNRLEDVEGQRAMLHVAHGRVRDLTQDEARDVAAQSHAIPTNREVA